MTNQRKSKKPTAKPRAANRPGDATISDAAVEKATGHPWAEWFRILDAKGGASMTHQAIVSILAGAFGLSLWWSQMVTVAYERERGLRAVNEVHDGFQITKSKTYPVPLEQLFAAVVDAERRSAWCSDELIVTKVTPQKAVLARIEGRSVRAGPTRLELRFQNMGAGKSSLSIQESKLKSVTAAERRKRAWGAALEALERELT